MSEYIMQVCVASLITCAIAVAVVSTIGEKWARKPWSCVYCMTVWVGLLVSIGMFDATLLALVSWPIVHILAYAFYQKAL